MQISATTIAKMYALAGTNESAADRYAPQFSAHHVQIRAFLHDNNVADEPSFWCTLGIENDVIIAAKNRKILVLSVIYSKAFAERINRLLKDGYGLLWIGKCYINWKTWTRVYKRLCPSVQVQREYDPQMTKRERRERITNLRRERMHKDMATPVGRYKKLGKRGYNLTFNELKARQMMEEMESEERKIVKNVRQILELL